MTPFLMAAGSGLQDIVQYLCGLWPESHLPFHMCHGGRNVLQLTKLAGGPYENRYQWLLTNVKSPNGDKLVMTHGEGRSYAERTSGAISKAFSQSMTVGEGKAGVVWTRGKGKPQKMEKRKTMENAVKPASRLP